jgi:nucleoside-diphosphate-sugar epimerase
MVATNGRTVTVFGGTGFLGRRIVQHLRSLGFFPFGSRQGIRIGETVSLVLMIRNFNR